MQEKLKVEFPSQGWKQVLTGRQEMLDSYDRARTQASSHETETFHGRVAEAACRKWLSDFLPKRYGVTSGYVISPGLSSSVKIPHYDVIIYDQLESPVLWVEHSPDASEQGKSLAIPVEYVQAVLEVKSAFTSQTAKDSIEHLKDLSPVMGGLDDPQERYRLHLPKTFCCGSLFFELRRDQQYSEGALSAMIEGIGLRGFIGGVVLRCEGHTEPQTGRIMLTESATAIASTVKDRETPLGEFGMSKSVQVADYLHIGSMISWSESAFAQFAFDLIAIMQGTYELGRLSSFYGLGSSFFELIERAGVTIKRINDSES